jgi:hypothetical protein
MCEKENEQRKRERRATGSLRRDRHVSPAPLHICNVITHKAPESWPPFPDARPGGDLPLHFFRALAGLGRSACFYQQSILLTELETWAMEREQELQVTLRDMNART